VITITPSCLCAGQNFEYVNIYHFLEKFYLLARRSFQLSAFSFQRIESINQSRKHERVGTRINADNTDKDFYLTPARLSSLEAQSAQRGFAATKSEARNPKFETNQNDRNPNDLNKFKNETENLLNEISRKCTLVVQRKPLLEINMSTLPREADKPFDSTQGHEPSRVASSSLLLARVASIPRLRLATRASPAISSETMKAF
jgi:hypothetical protein